MPRYAAIDLGTNTFHLLIVEQEADGSLRELKRLRSFVKLGEEGIETIGKAAYERGLQALQVYKKIIDKYEVKFVKACGTAALRSATNGPDSVKDVKTKTKIIVSLIPGNREAELIYKGVKLAVPFKDERKLIMDIGGGSVEFILANGSTIHWAQSFPIGVAVLFNRFHKSDPIKNSEIQKLQNFLKEELAPLFSALGNFPAYHLVGASGTFDVLENILANTKINTLSAQIPAGLFRPFYEQLLKTTLEERLTMSKIPPKRVDLIIVALILIDFIIQQAHIDEIIVSSYAMKEGMLLEMMEGEF